MGAGGEGIKINFADGDFTMEEILDRMSPERRQREHAIREAERAGTEWTVCSIATVLAEDPPSARADLKEALELEAEAGLISPGAAEIIRDQIS